MNAKKLLLLLLALCLVVCLAACGDGGATVEKPEPEEPDGGYEGDGGEGDEEHTVHSWRSWEVYQEPTETSGGKLRRECDGCDETDEYTLPMLNATDYTVTNAWYPEQEITCADESVYAAFTCTVEDAAEGTREFSFFARYSPEHPAITEVEYTLWTKDNHYAACAVCGKAYTEVHEAHAMADGECTVCHYVPDSLIYAEDKGSSTGVSYTANEETVVIPTVYGGSNPDKAGFAVMNIDSFQNNDALVSLTIPASVDFISSDAFDGCTALENIYYEGTWADWCDIYFVNWKSNPMFYATNFYMRDGNGEWTKVTEIEIPNTVTKITNYTFIGFTGIEKLTIPASVTKIEHAFCDGYFSECHFSHYIYDDDGWWIGNTCDFGEVYYGGSVEKWASISFDNFGSPLQKSSKLYLYEDGEYVAHTSITELTIPESVTDIGAYAFYGFSGLESVTALGKLYYVREKAFYNCTSLTSVDISAGCVYLDSGVFGNCTSLYEIKLPADLRQTNTTTFVNANAIANVYFHGTLADWCKINIRGIGSGDGFEVGSPLHAGARLWLPDPTLPEGTVGYVDPFEYNLYITIHNGESLALSTPFLIIPESVTEIGKYQFYGMHSEESYTVIIEGDVTSIGEHAFENSNVKKVFIPKSVTSIDSDAFGESFGSYCSVYYEGTAAEWNAISSSTDFTDVDIYVYAATVDQISGDADGYWFYGEDGFVYEWVSLNVGTYEAKLNEALSLGNFVS